MSTLKGQFMTLHVMSYTEFHATLLTVDHGNAFIFHFRKMDLLLVKEKSYLQPSSQGLMSLVFQSSG